MEQQTAVVISYMPLLDPQKLAVTPGEMIALETPEDIKRALGETIQEAEDCGTAKGCLWIRDEDKVSPVLILEKGDEIFNHIKWWSEEKPETRFTLYIYDNLGDPSRKKDGYAIILMPNIALSIERWRMAYLLRKGVNPPNYNYNVLFRPIAFSGPSNTYIQVRDQIPEIGGFIRLSIVDFKHVDMANPMSLDETKIQTLGVFRRGDNTDHNESYLTSYLETD